jgi:hypothetical protein
MERDPKRMKRILGKIESVWETVPDWRLNQLLFNVHGDRGDTFYMEDKDFEERLDNFIKIYVDKNK